jgi:flagellar basal-body rod protein FlgB
MAGKARLIRASPRRTGANNPGKPTDARFRVAAAMRRGPPMLDRLTDTLNFQGQALQLRAERQRLVASNIANADTPGYIARDMDFAKTLRAATGSLPAARTVSTTHAGHIGAGAPGLNGSLAGSDLLYATPSQTNLDRNTVDMDRERASFADNAVKYEATLRFINSNVRTSLSAITGQ